MGEPKKTSAYRHRGKISVEQIIAELRKSETLRSRLLGIRVGIERKAKGLSSANLESAGEQWSQHVHKILSPEIGKLDGFADFEAAVFQLRNAQIGAEQFGVIPALARGVSSRRITNASPVDGQAIDLVAVEL